MVVSGASSAKAAPVEQTLPESLQNRALVAKNPFRSSQLWAKTKIRQVGDHFMGHSSHRSHSSHSSHRSHSSHSSHFSSTGGGSYSPYVPSYTPPVYSPPVYSSPVYTPPTSTLPPVIATTTTTTTAPPITAASCLSPGEWTPEELMLVEKRLKARGFNPGRIDGDFGTRAFAALRSFERKNRLKASTGSYESGYNIQVTTLIALGIRDC